MLSLLQGNHSHNRKVGGLFTCFRTTFVPIHHSIVRAIKRLTVQPFTPHHSENGVPVIPVEVVS